VPPFALGERDSSARFLIRHKLYGRGGERAALLSTFERVVDTERPALMLVSGSPGIGKSTLVEELQRAIVRQRGFFVTGKFDLRKRETPHLPFVQVFRDLMLEILSQSEDRIADWKRRLTAALGRSAQVIVDMIPELELVLGPQPPVPKLPPNEAENRLFLLVRQFLAVFAQKQHPLTIFFDDMQWADPASLRLLSYVITDPDTRYLFLIGAYRDDEVTSTHQLCVTVDQIRHARDFSRRAWLRQGHAWSARDVNRA
jgi:predicted ATPase